MDLLGIDDKPNKNEFDSNFIDQIGLDTNVNTENY